MNYTENYHLPQWEETDRIMRTDFNDAMANIDQGVAQAAVVPVAVGSYVGKGAAQEITVGFRPSFVIIAASQAGGINSEMGGFSGFSEAQTSGDNVTFTDTGFIVASVTSLPYPRINRGGNTYAYIAFR